MAAELKIGIGADNSGLNKGLQDAEKQITAFVSKIDKIAQVGEKLSSIGQKMTVGLTLPLAAAGTAAYMMAADFEDALGATNQIFKESSDAVQKWANKLPSYYGIAKKEALEYSNMMGSMLKNIGGLTDQEASQQSAKLIELAGDLTAMYGGTTADAVYALTGALKGNNTMLDNYGMAANDALVKAKALEMGLVSQGKEMSLAAKQAATLALIYDQAGAATGQAAREAGGASGSMRALKTEIKNLTTELGANLLPIIAPITQKLQELIAGFRDLSPQVKQVIVSVGLAVAAAGPLLVVVGGFLAALPAMTAGFGAVSLAIAKAGGVMGLLMNPITLVTAGIAGIIALVVANWSKITPYLVRTANNFIQLYNESETFRGAVLGIGLAFEGTYTVIKSFAISAYNTLKSFGKGVLSLFEGVSLMIRGAFNLDGDMIGQGWAKANAKVALSFDDLGSRIDGLNAKYKNLFNSGPRKMVTAADFEITSDPEKTADVIVDEIQKGAKKVKEKKIKVELPDIEPIAQSTKGFIDMLGNEVKNFWEIDDPLSKVSDSFKNLPNVIAESTAKVSELSASFSESLTNLINQSLVNTISDSFASLGQAIASGENGFAAAGKSLLGSFGGFMQDLGKMAIAYGIQALALKMALKSFNPYIAIAAGAALVAIGSVFSSKMSSMGSNYAGGGSSGGISTSGGGGSNFTSSSFTSGGNVGGEVVFRIAGTDLLGVLKRADADFQRLN